MEAIRQYARDHDVRIAKVFREEGVSGTEDLLSSADRFAPCYMVMGSSETIMAGTKKPGFAIVSVSEPDLCGNDPSRKLMRQVFGAIAAYEKTMTVLKFSGARERKRAQEGRCEGGRPYRYYAGGSKQSWIT